MGTFSKVLFPSLRIGYLVLPEPLVKVFSGARWLCDRQTPTIEQQVLADFINEGHLERHIRQMRQLYDRRRQTLVRSLKHYLGERVEILGDNAGIHLMAKIDSKRSDLEIVEAAKNAGVGLVSTQIYHSQKCDRGQFLFGYSELNEEQIIEGIEILAQILV
jgi:GntR family transcriptional regulator / MocR family aminotransferase